MSNGAGELQAAVDALLARLKAAGWKERDAVKEELLAFTTSGDTAAIRELLDAKRMSLPLEVRWEVDEVLEATEVKAEPEPEPEPEEEEEDPNRPLTAADLDLVYDDPRGLMLYKHKRSDAWFATQVDPRSGQPQTFQLHPSEVEQLKTQLANSPYWVLGSGAGPGA